MRSAKLERRLDWRAAVVAVPAAVVLLLAAGCTGQNGPTASPATSSRVSALEAQANAALALLTTERAASSDLSTNNLQPPDDYCSNLTAQFGGTETTGTVSGTVVTIPSFTAPSTFGFDAKAAALRDEQQTERQWSDAISTALPLTKVGNKWQFTMSAVEASVCSEPDYAAQMILGLSNIEIGGITVAHLNRWMTEGSPSPLKTVQWASQCMNGGFAVQVKCAQVMQDAAFILTKFQSMGVHHDSPSWYFKLRNGLVVGSIPPIESVYGSYSGYFLEFQYTTKAGGCFLRLGVNVGRFKPNGGDKRLAGFLCGQPQVPASASAIPSVPATARTQPAPTPSQTHPVPSPTTSTPSTSPSMSPTTTAPPTHCGCTSPPVTTPPTTAPPTSPPTTGCGCTSTPTPTVSATPSPTDSCGCQSTPTATYSPSATPSSTATPTDTPSPQCTCMDTVSQVQGLASKLGFTNIFVYGAYPPPGTKKGATLDS